MSTDRKYDIISNGKFTAVLFNIVLIASILLLTQFYRLFSNTIENNGRWHSTKTELTKGVMGAHAFLVTQRGLAGGRLDLGAWHGHQELFMDIDEPYHSVSFEFEMEQEAHFVLYYAKRDEYWSAIRISTDNNFPTAQLMVDQGAFLSNTALKLPSIPDGKHYLRLTIGDEGTELKLNDHTVVLPDAPGTIFNAVGFRGSGRSVLIDNIEIFNVDGQLIRSEKFKRRLPGVPIFGIVLFGLILFNLLLKRSKLRRFAISALILLFIGSIALYIYYHQVGQYRYPKDARAIRYGGYTPNIQTVRDIQNLAPPEGYQPDHELLDEFGTSKMDGKTHVLFIGASQTWGAGASQDTLTWASGLISNWNKGCEDRHIGMNAAVSGQESGSLLKFHRYVTRYLKPDICMINLSFNDRNTDTASFRNNLEAFIALNNADSIVTVLIPEISNPETRNKLSEDRVSLNRRIVEEVGDEHDVIVVSMQDTMWSLRNSGFIFWDDVHLTDFGQELYAAILTEKLQDELPACRLLEQYD